MVEYDVGYKTFLIATHALISWNSPGAKDKVNEKLVEIHITHKYRSRVKYKLLYNFVAA